MLRDGEAAREDIGGDRLGVRRLRRGAKARSGVRQDAGLSHQPGDPMLPTGEAERAQFHPDPRTAIALPDLALDVANLLRQDAIGTDPIAERPRTPCVVAGPRHLQHPTHRPHVPDAGMRLDEGESHRRSLAKKAVAFFKISRSSRSRSFSRLSCRTCSSSESTRPGPGFWVVTVRSQLRSVVTLTPSSVASSFNGRSDSWTSRTASRRNSSANCSGPRLRIDHPLPRISFEASEVSTKPGEVHTVKFLELSGDLPIVIECVDSAEKIDAVLPELDAMIGGGLITLEKVDVIVYRASERP